MKSSTIIWIIVLVLFIVFSVLYIDYAKGLNDKANKYCNEQGYKTKYIGFEYFTCDTSAPIITYKQIKYEDLK